MITAPDIKYKLATLRKNFIKVVLEMHTYKYITDSGNTLTEDFEYKKEPSQIDIFSAFKITINKILHHNF